MTLPELAQLIADMRHAQREYFRTRAPAALATSKAAEKKVDDAVAQILDYRGGLFPEESDA